MTKTIDDFTNKLFNAKWEEVLPKIPDNSVDIVITSPPYNVSLGIGNRNKMDAYDGYEDDMPYNDYLAWLDGLWKECYRVLKVGGRLAINIGDGRNGCYDDQTEILTKNGWKFFDCLTHDDEVITLNPTTHAIEWQKPTAIQKYPYDGEMCKVKHYRMDLMVTPNHRMLVEKHHTKGWFFDEIQNFNQYQYYLPGAIGKCEDGVVDDFVLPSMYLRNRKNKEIPLKRIKMEDFVEFLGWYITEGCCSCNQRDKFRITISQSLSYNPNKHNQILQCVKRMGYNPNCFKDQIRIHDKQLCCWLENNIKKYAHNKNIPDFVMSLPRNYLTILFNAMIDGDGCRHKNGQVRFYTSSKVLAGQIQAIGLKIGLISTNNTRLPRIGGKINGRQIQKELSSYEVTFSSRDRIWLNTKNIRREQYSGYVYCCSVPNTIIYVKRNNFSVWCGNSIPTHADFIHRMRKVTETTDGKGFQMMANLVWEKSQISNRFSWGSWQSPSQPSFPKPFEYIIIMGKDTCNHEGAKEDITVTKKEFKDFSLGLWKIQPETRMMELYHHPAVMPEEMPYRLIQMLTYKNDIVLEPFLGSGTVCAVAKRTGRRYIGVEMSKKYYDIASERVRNTAITQKVAKDDAKPKETSGSLFD